MFFLACLYRVVRSQGHDVQEADLVHGGCEPQDKLSASGVRAGRSTALHPYLAEREMCLAK